MQYVSKDMGGSLWWGDIGRKGAEQGREGGGLEPPVPKDAPQEAA